MLLVQNNKDNDRFAKLRFDLSTYTGRSEGKYNF